MISASKKALMRKVINCFETGGPNTDYSTIFIYRDGPNSIRQITLGFGVTEYGNLQRLVQVYINDSGLFADSFKPYVNKIGRTPLVDDFAFKQLLVKAAKNDPIFRAAEDKIFEERYFAPAISFFEFNGFKTPLALMVILDSYIHSGSIPMFLRTRFPASTPRNGGNEEQWITQYVDVRHNWLSSHSRSILRGTIYRTDCFKRQIRDDNWQFDAPIVANGIRINS